MNHLPVSFRSMDDAGRRDMVPGPELALARFADLFCCFASVCAFLHFCMAAALMMHSDVAASAVNYVIAVAEAAIVCFIGPGALWYSDMFPAD